MTQQQGFYRRPLPAACVPFASTEGRALFREALAEGHLEGWFALAEQFQTQAEPSFCGLGTLVVALNALGIDPGRVWKGPWRWYSEELLDCCLPLDSVRERGVTLGQFACLARCNGAAAEVHRPDTATLERFRADLTAACAAPEGLVVAVSYSRGALSQTGDGHFSPIAGLHAARDLALVLDVARFKYPPHWVPVQALWEAMKPPDPATKKPRGWVVLTRRPSGASVLFRLSDTRIPWASIARRLLVEVPAALRASSPRSAAEIVDALVEVLSTDASAVLAQLPTGLDAPSSAHEAQASALLAQLRRAPLFAAVERASSARAPDASPRLAELLTALTLGLPDHVFSALDPDARAALARLREVDPADAVLSAEVEALREQIGALAAASGPPDADVDRAPCG